MASLSSHVKCHRLLGSNGSHRLTALEGAAGGVNPGFFIQQKYPVRPEEKEIWGKMTSGFAIGRLLEETLRERDSPEAEGTGYRVNTRVFRKEGGMVQREVKTK